MRLETPSRVQQLQRKLYRKSKAEPGYRFYTLWDKACRRDVLEEAWLRVKANKGSGGIDGETIAAIEQAGASSFLSALEADLKARAYKPMPVRRVWIPKASGGKRFLNWGLVNVVDADIRDFFGQIPHDKLLRVIARRVADGQVLRVVKQWLSAGVMEEGRMRAETTGTPQGGVISPLLANAYLNELDAHWEQAGYRARNGWNTHLVRYADDLVILTDKDAAKPLEAVRRTLAGLGLELHPDKTRLVNADEGSFDFLGFNFRKVPNREKTKRFTLFFPSKKAEASIRAKIRNITRYERTDKLETVIQEINPVVRGWVNYFRLGNSSRSFHEIRDYIVKKSMRYLRRKQLRRGYGWKKLTSDVLYGRYGLFYDYGVRFTASGGAAC